ncbi:MAG TPA: major facilitator superfamily domain-containing protein 6 [Anaerolineae bacterium]|nr:major facilitator superfamily domain-containing protein 6 [Anaerolineae bacterium]
MNKAWPFTLNFLLFVATAFVMPFLVLYYQNLGFTGTQIGLLAGLTPLVTLISAPFWTGLADKTQRHRLIMSIAILASVVVLVVFPWFSAFAPILILVLLYGAFNAPVSSFIDSATMFMLADRKELYGRVRLGGTLGYGIAAVVAGVFVQNNGLKYAFWGGAIAMFLALLVSQKLVFGEAKTSVSIQQGARTLLADRRWFLFLTLALTGGFALTAVNTYFFPYLKELGTTESMMGLALTIGTLSEIPVLFFGNRLLLRFKTNGLLLLALIVTGLRLILLAAAHTPEMILVLQLLNGLTFPAMWVAGVAYADQNAPAGMRSTAQGLFGATVFGLGLAVGGFIGGPILENWGGHALFLIFGVVVLIVVGCVALLQKRWQLAPQGSEA